MHRSGKKITTLLLILACTGGFLFCGKTTYRLIYDNFGLFIRYKAGQYISLRPAQSAFIKERVDRFLVWHRSVKLDEYVTFLRGVQERIVRGVKQEDIDWGASWAQKEQEDIIYRIADDIAEFLTTIDEKQKLELKAKLDEQTARFERKLVTDPAKLHEERTAFVLKLAQYVHGPFTDAQKAEVNRRTAAMTDISTIKIIMRKIVINEFISLLGANADRDRLRAAILKWTVSFRNYIPEQYRSSIRALQEEYNTLLFGIFMEVLTDGQRSYTLKRIDHFIEILQYIRKG